MEILNNKGLSPIDRIKQGMKVEVQNTLDPYKYWIATVCNILFHTIIAMRLYTKSFQQDKAWGFPLTSAKNNFVQQG